MPLLELPLDLVLNIIARAVLSGEVATILRLRQVNRLFDREVTRYLAKLRLQDLDLGRLYIPPHIPESFGFRLVLESIGKQYRGHNEFKTFIHAVTDDLVSRLAELKIPSHRPEILQSVCKTALTYRSFWPICRDLLNDGEDWGDGSCGYLGEDESCEGCEIAQSSFVIVVASRYTEVQSAMLQSGVDLDFQTRQFGVPLNMAARLGYCDTVEILLNKGATIGQAFDTAVSSGHIAIVQLLLDPKHRLKTSSRSYGEAAYLAVKHGHLEIATMILERRKKIPKPFQREICYWAARHGYDKLMVAMLDAGIRLDRIFCESSSPLAAAVEGGHLSTLRLLLDRGGGGCQPAKFAFCDAVRTGQIEILEMFLQRGVYLEPGTTLQAFHAAVRAGNFPGVHFLLDNELIICSAEAKFWQYGALQEAIWGNGNRKNVDMVRWLILNFGLSPDGHDREPQAAFNNNSPMSVALERGRPEVVNLLFQLGAKPIDLTAVESHSLTRKQQAAFDQYHVWEAEL